MVSRRKSGFKLFHSGIAWWLAAMLEIEIAPGFTTALAFHKVRWLASSEAFSRTGDAALRRSGYVAWRMLA
jgi:hypothetical protein